MIIFVCLFVAVVSFQNVPCLNSIIIQTIFNLFYNTFSLMNSHLKFNYILSFEQLHCQKLQEKEKLETVMQQFSLHAFSFVLILIINNLCIVSLNFVSLCQIQRSYDMIYLANVFSLSLWSISVAFFGNCLFGRKIVKLRQNQTKTNTNSKHFIHKLLTVIAIFFPYATTLLEWWNCLFFLFGLERIRL